MKTHVLFLFLMTIMVGYLSAQSQRSDLQEVEQSQIQVSEGVNGLADRIEPVLEELAALGASREDMELVRESLAQLRQLSDEEIMAILVALRQAVADPAQAEESLRTALAGQERVLQSLGLLFDRLRQRQQEMELASKAEALRRRQAQNRHQTELARQGQGDRVAAEAEQRAIEDAVNDLTREAEAMAEAARQEGNEQAALDQGDIDAMKQWAQQATADIQNQELDQAVADQARLEEMLADLAAQTGQEQASAEFAENLVLQLQALLERQQALIRSGPAQDPAAQESLAAETELVRVPVENVNAPAGYQVAAAADNMRQAFVKLSTSPPQDARPVQDMAIQALELAIKLLQQNIENMQQNAQQQTPEEQLQDLADMYRKADELQKRQEQVNHQGGNQQEQAALARETAELQKDVLEDSPEAARDLGRAAARMAEAMNADKTPQERQELREEAARQLARATQAVLEKGRAMRNDPPGQQGGGLSSMGEVALESDVLGPETLTPAERDAIAAAQDQPVSPEYAPLVEAYYDKLSRRTHADE
jgi:hypothetical protein